MVDEQYPQASPWQIGRAGDRPVGWRGRGELAFRMRVVWLREHVEQRSGFEPGLALLGGWVGVEQQRRPCPYAGQPVADLGGAQRQASVHVAVEAERADRSPVPAARAGLVIFDEPHRPGLRRAGYGHRPHVREKRVKGVELRPQPTFDVVDGVDDPAVQLDLPAADDLHAAGHADPRLVVAIHVGAHGEFGLLLGRYEQSPDVLRVGQRIVAARYGSGSVACHPDVHLRGGTDQELAVAQVQEELERRRVAPPQPFVERGR